MLGFLVVMTLLLYEPVLVSFTGGTLGHYFTNLRVVDDRDGGNVSFLKACARVVIKGLLGWYSFVGSVCYRAQRTSKRDHAVAVAARCRDFVYLLMSFISGAAAALGSMSRRCTQNDSLCSSGEGMINAVGSFAMLFMTALIIGLGWKGRLFGARKV